jgi:hypothetical protein
MLGRAGPKFCREGKGLAAGGTVTSSRGEE